MDILQKNPDPKKSLGEKLILSGRYAISAVQISCYLPLTVSHGELVMNFTSNTFISQIILTALIPLAAAYLSSKPTVHGKLFETLTYTEQFVMTIISTAYTFVTIYFRFSGFLRRKSILRFWESNVDLFLEFNRMEGIESDTELTKIRMSIKRDFIFVVFGILSWNFGAAFLYFSFWNDVESVGLSQDLGILICQSYFYFLVFSHGSQAIWLNYFIKLNVGMLNLIESNVEAAGSSFRNYSSQITALRLSHDRIGDSYKLYLKVEKQLENFTHHFKDALILECLLGMLNLLGYAFVIMRWVSEGSNARVAMAMLTIPVVGVSGKSLYDLATAGTRLSEAISRITYQIHHFYQQRALPFYLRLDLLMFATRTTNSSVLSVGQYFMYNRALLTHILSTISTYLIILIQFRAAEKKK